MQSVNINELATALSKAQAIMDRAHKDSANPFFHSTYADLTSCWDACRKPLADNGLCVVQTAAIHDPVGLILRTTLLHTSGQWMASELPLRPVKDDPQGLGSCLTYMRRYGLCAMVGISPEDDDGNAATGQKRKGKGKSEPKPPKPSPDIKAKASHALDEAADGKHLQKIIDKIRLDFHGTAELPPLLETARERMALFTVDAIDAATGPAALDKIADHVKKWDFTANQREDLDKLLTTKRG